MIVAPTRPDLTLILDLPADVGLARAADRRRANAVVGTQADAYEKRDLAFHERLRAGYADDRQGRAAALRAGRWRQIARRHRRRDLGARRAPAPRGCRLMARAPAIQDTEALPEADRLEGFPHPRETRVLFGHGEAERELAQTFAGGRMHHAWLIAGREGHRQGDAGLSAGPARAGATRGARSGGPEPGGRRADARRRGRCARCRIRAFWCCAGPTTRAPSALRPASSSTRCAGSDRFWA